MGNFGLIKGKIVFLRVGNDITSLLTYRLKRRKAVFTDTFDYFKHVISCIFSLNNPQDRV